MFLIPGIPHEALTSERNGLHGLHQPAHPLSPDLPGHSPAIAGFYRPRHPERTVLYRVLFYHFERFVAEYKGLVVASWANYSNRGKGNILRVARRLIWKHCFLT